jgi:class 3 adenylate cyclase/tetratricopeptide (TPR) repeat protein
VADLPTGTVTFLFTDIEGSTRLWEEQPEAMQVARARQEAIIGECVEHHGGSLLKTRGEGDSCFAVFSQATDAVAAAAALQRALFAEPWPDEFPMRVRVALHTGEAGPEDGDYHASAVNRCARLRAIAHGGQALLSRAAHEAARERLPEGVTLRDLGSHFLRDLAHPEQVYQLCHPELPPEFPPLKSGGAAMLDLEAYRGYLRSRFSAWEKQYTLLNVEPLVTVGAELAPGAAMPVPVTEAVERSERLVILGTAGAGKTSSLHFIAHAFSAGYPQGGGLPRLPEVFCLYLELARFQASPGRSPLECLLRLIEEELYVGGAATERPTPESVHRFLAENQVLLLLDGLNEVQTDLQQLCRRGIEDLARRHQGNRYLLATRPHAFSPLEGWDVVTLRPLGDYQIEGFIERHTDAPTARRIMASIRDREDSLLRVPLFLHYVAQIAASPGTQLQLRMGSRSGLVAAYAEYLLGRDDPPGGTAADLLRRGEQVQALHRLAEALQRAGQSLRLEDARRAVSDGSAYAVAGVAARLLDPLCERGLLVQEGGYLRFWHHTLQEHFYAGAVVARWREGRRSAGRVPRWLRRLLRDPGRHDALAHLVAQLSADEVTPALSAAARESPALALAWADDPQAEARAPDAITRCLQIFRASAGVARWYSWFGPTRRRAAGRLALFALGFGLVASSVLLNLGFRGLYPSGVWSALLFWIPATLCLILAVGAIHSHLIYWGTGGLEVLFGAGMNVRDPDLRFRLAGLAQEVSRRSIGDVKSLAQTLAQADLRADVLDLLRGSRSLYNSIRVLGFARAPDALPVLEGFLGYGNVYSVAAVDALEQRFPRFPEEREPIKEAAWNLWRGERRDRGLRQAARRLLLRAGEKPGGLSERAASALPRLAMGLGLALGADLLLGAIALVIAAAVPAASRLEYHLSPRDMPDVLLLLRSSYADFGLAVIGLNRKDVLDLALGWSLYVVALPGNPAAALASWGVLAKFATLFPARFLIGMVTLWASRRVGAGLIWSDAGRIGAQAIRGHAGFDGWAPKHYALWFFFLPVVGLPIYLLNRQRIRRNAAPINWAALEARLAAAQTGTKPDVMPAARVEEVDPAPPVRVPWRRRAWAAARCCGALQIGLVLLLVGTAELALQARYGRQEVFVASVWRGIDAQSHGRWTDAVRDFSRAIAMDPPGSGNWAAFARRGRADAYATGGQWQKAKEDYIQVVARDPSDLTSCYRCALVLLASGDLDAYRSACAGMLEHYRATPARNAWSATTVAWTCVLGPKSAGNPETPAALAREAASHDGFGSQAAASRTLGAALYRAGHFEEAVPRLLEAFRLGEVSLRRHSDEGLAKVECTALFLSMAYCRLGRKDLARAWFEAARPGENPFAPQLWDHRLEVELLRREAEALLRARPALGSSTRPRR